MNPSLGETQIVRYMYLQQTYFTCQPPPTPRLRLLGKEIRGGRVLSEVILDRDSVFKSKPFQTSLVKMQPVIPRDGGGGRPSAGHASSITTGSCPAFSLLVVNASASRAADFLNV